MSARPFSEKTKVYIVTGLGVYFGLCSKDAQIEVKHNLQKIKKQPLDALMLASPKLNDQSMKTYLSGSDERVAFADRLAKFCEKRLETQYTPRLVFGKSVVAGVTLGLPLTTHFMSMLPCNMLDYSILLYTGRGDLTAEEKEFEVVEAACFYDKSFNNANHGNFMAPWSREGKGDVFDCTGSSQ
eukprot:g46984.t1